MSTPITKNEIAFETVAQTVEEKLASGLFLTTFAVGMEPNTMTIGWGGLGRFFNLPMFFVPVRKSRYTYTLLQKSGVFTVSVPLHDMKAELGFAGTKSGRDIHKFEGHGLTAAPSLELATPIVGECGLHFECRVVASTDLTEAHIAGAMNERWYADHDMHTLFFGQILRCYYTE